MHLHANNERKSEEKMAVVTEATETWIQEQKLTISAQKTRNFRQNPTVRINGYSVFCIDGAMNHQRTPSKLED